MIYHFREKSLLINDSPKTLSDGAEPVFLAQQFVFLLGFIPVCGTQKVPDTELIAV
jgi:hypothetical protein